MRPTTSAISFAGAAYVALAACLAAFIAGRADIGDYVPWKDAQVASYLIAADAHRDAIRTAFAFGVAIDAILVLVVGAATYVVFRDRSALLAAIACVAFVANGAMSGVADGVGIVLTFIAHDFVNAAGSAATVQQTASLEVGRAIGILQLALTQIESTSFGLAEIAIGMLIVFAPPGAVAPPRLVGWTGIAAGTAAILAWGIVVSQAFLSFMVFNSVSTIVFLAALGTWLLLHRHA